MKQAFKKGEIVHRIGLNDAKIKNIYELKIVGTNKVYNYLYEFDDIDKFLPQTWLNKIKDNN